MMRQSPSEFRRQIELNVPSSLPAGSKIGPELIARSPEERTSTIVGRQEKGASGFSNKGFHASATASRPRIGLSPAKKIASSDRKDTKPLKLRSAMVAAKASSESRTSDCRSSGFSFF